MQKNLVRNGIGMGLVALIAAPHLGAGGMATVAGAASATTGAGSPSGKLSDIQSIAARAIKLRVTALDKARAKVDRSKGIGPNVAMLNRYLTLIVHKNPEILREAMNRAA